jgi:phosphate/sulfate permease
MQKIRIAPIVAILVCATLVMSLNLDILKDKSDENSTSVKKIVSQIANFFTHGNNETNQTPSDDITHKNWIEVFRFGNMWDKIKGGINAGVQILKHEISLTSDKIESAIDKSHQGLKKIMNQTKNIHLPNVSFPKSIKSIKMDDIKPTSCVKNLKPALPGLISFSRAAADENISLAVSSLFGVLRYMPDISRNCIGQELKMSSNEVNNNKCVNDIVELVQIVSHLAQSPENVINDARSIKKMVALVPGCISHCTTAFN